ncbi:hypothetical protein FACS189447_03600 [Spirochaetia bacterium]|nr:hypothetical protein FACS189447_03600 [Spirochaetia bacterium]
MSIRLKVIFIISSIVLFIAAAGSGVGIYSSRRNMVSTIENDMILVVKTASRMVSIELKRLREQIEAIEDRISSAKDEKEILDILESQGKRNDFLSVAIMGEDGYFLVQGETLLTKAFLKTSYGERALKGETFVTTTEQGIWNQLVFRIITPVGENSILVATLPALYFNDILRDLKIWKTGYIFAIDNEGYTVASVDPEEVINRQSWDEKIKTDPQLLPASPLINAMRNGESGIQQYALRGEFRVAAYMPIADSGGWGLAAISPLSESPMTQVRTSLILAGAVVFFLGVIAASFAAKSITIPFEQLNVQNKTLEELRSVAESASSAKSDFLANMSHEMRTPLNAIIGFAELELGKDGEMTSEARDNLEKIYTSGITLLGLINDILDISKIESGKFALVPVEYDIPSLINDTVVLNIVRIGSKPITFELDIDGSLPSKLFGDELRIKQIFNNLLSNAFKYTREGKVTLSIHCKHKADTAEKDTVWIELTVSDTGIGIKPEDMDSIFDDYTQVDAKSNRKIEGTGLGLPITKRLTEMMGGRISASSVYNEGSVFKAWIPQGYITDVPIGNEVADNLKTFQYILGRRDRSKKLTQAYIPYAKVLVVDDVSTNLDVARGMLKRYGLTVDCVSNGQSAVDRIRKGDPVYNAVFMDHMMPGMDGIEATRIIRSEINSDYARTIPIIALTANAIIGNEEIFLKNGFQAFLTKPIDIIKLNEVINRWVRNREYEKELRQTQGLPETAPGGLDMRSPQAEPVGRQSADEKVNLNTLLYTHPIQGVDTQKALERFGDAETWLEAAASYVKNTPALLDNLKAIAAGEISEENLDKYRITVHGIKGASRSISAETVGDLAEKLEHAAREKNAALLRNETSSFAAMTAKLIDNFAGLIAEVNALSTKPKKPAPDPEIIKKVSEAASSYNMQALDKALETLEQYSYESGGELVAWLREQADFSEFGAISEKLNKG